MEFLRPSRHRTILSESVYILLNIGLALGLLGLVIAVQSPIPAFGLILLSKWRIFAVRPQYWSTNLLSNLIDIILSVSVVILLYAASGAIVVQILLALFYVVWLLVIKPSSRQSVILAQAGLGLFFGVSALSQISYSWWSSMVVLVMWLIGYAAARHIFSTYHEAHYSLFSLIWGFVVAELGWILYHWTYAYHTKFTGDLQLSQTAIIVFLLSFLAERTYASYHRNKIIKMGDVMLPLLLTTSIIGLLLVLFNTIPITSS